ncbi:hypothetical protein JXB01_03715 [Candidatus Micrarchaeota archaeon]|nr:hypothetical protein [Candidatus Micrarchaeota archaeon]
MKYQVLKLGGSILTKKHGYMELDEENIEKLSKSIGKMWNKVKGKLILVHGAGSFGHAPVLRYGIKRGVKTSKQKLGFADTHAACSYLSFVLTDALIKNGVPAVSIPPAVIVKQKKGKITKVDDQVVFEFMKNGYLPVLYGDMILDSSTGGSVMSGDVMVTYFGKKAQNLILASNVDGVYMKGKIVKQISKRNLPEVEKYVGESETPDVTGGMTGKIRELIKLKTRSYIVNGLHPKRVELLLNGKPTICTEIKV